MAENSQNSEGLPLSSEEIDEINEGFVTYLRSSGQAYGLKQLLKKRKIDMLNPSRSIETPQWKYVFTRVVPEYLQLSIDRRPISKESAETNLIWERVDIICGRVPLIQYDVMKAGDLKLPPVKNDTNAVKAVSAFVSELISKI